MRKFYVEVTSEVEVTVHDDSVIARVLENHDDDGQPTPRGGNGWQDMFYAMDTEGDVVEHLAYNYIANGVETISRLDGWADVEAGAVEFRTNRTLFDFFEEL